MHLRPHAAALVYRGSERCRELYISTLAAAASDVMAYDRSVWSVEFERHGYACLFSWCGPSLSCVSEANQQALRAFFAGLDEEAHDLAERLAHGDDESVWAWFECRYPKATKRAAHGRHWREFVTAIREFYGDETRLQ